MTGKWQFVLVAVALSACASVSNETVRTITLDGRSYDLRTRTIEGTNGTFETSSVKVHGSYFQCKPDSPGDCEAAVRTGRNSGSDRN